MSENVIKAQSAFLIVQRENGAYLAVTDLDSKVEVQRPVSLQDIKVACREISDAVVRADLLNSIKALFTPPAPDSEETSAPEAQ